jgi:hypothetical protein
MLIGIDARVYILDDTRVSWGDPGEDDNEGFNLGVAPEGLVALTTAGDLKIPLEKDKSDVTVRRSHYKLTKATLRAIAIDIPVIHDLEEEAYVALLAAYFTDTTIPIAFLDGAADVVGVTGLWCDFEVTKREIGQEINGVQHVTFTVEPAWGDVPPEYVLVTAPEEP